jgi:hypothetical protein
MLSLLLGRSSSVEAPQVVLKVLMVRSAAEPRVSNHGHGRIAKGPLARGATRFAIAPYAPDNENSRALICPTGNRINFFFRMPVHSPLCELENRIRKKPIC